MTSIAWDGETLASDSLTTDDGYVVDRTFKKIRHISTDLRGERTIAYAVAGDMEAFYPVKHWINGGCESRLPRDLDFQGLIVTKTKVYLFSSKTKDHLYETKNIAALGTGAPFLISAMTLGLNAKESIKHAIKLDTQSGGKIRSICCR